MWLPSLNKTVPYSQFDYLGIVKLLVQSLSTLGHFQDLHYSDTTGDSGQRRRLIQWSPITLSYLYHFYYYLLEVAYHIKSRNIYYKKVAYQKQEHFTLSISKAGTYLRINILEPGT